MKSFWERIEIPLVIGFLSTLNGELLNHLTKKRIKLDFSSFLESTILITVTGIVIMKANEELTGPP